MKNITAIFRTCALLTTFGFVLMMTGCGNSDSTTDSPSIGKDGTPSATPPTVEPRTPSSVIEEVTPSSTSPADEETSLEGELLKVEGDVYMMKDREGAVQQFQATSDTLIDEGMELGNNIIVKIGKEGNTIAIRKDR